MAINMTPNDKQHLRFIYNRMVEIHGENPNVDYMLKFNSIIEENPIKPSNSAVPFSQEQLTELHNKHHIYKHEDLHELFVEETMPSQDFKFIGTDGNIYRFDVDEWNWYLREEN